MKFYIKNWREFQHYRDRNPPWIKLHFSILSSEDWVALDDCSRVLVIACLLIGSRKQGEIDGSDRGLAYLRRAAYLHKKPDLNPLIRCGFLVSASNCEQMLAGARPETETETYKEEKEKTGFVLPDWVSTEAWKGFEEMRGKKAKTRLTDRARVLIVRELESLQCRGFEPSAVLDQSTRNGWADVYPIKAKDGGKGADLISSPPLSCAICHGPLVDGHTVRREGRVCNACEAQR